MAVLALDWDRIAMRSNRVRERIGQKGHLGRSHDFQFAPGEGKRSQKTLANDGIDVNVSHLQIALDPNSRIGQSDVRFNGRARSHFG